MGVFASILLIAWLAYRVFGRPKPKQRMPLQAKTPPVRITERPPAPEPPPITKALLIKVEAQQGVQATGAGGEIPITDARTLRRYVPYATDMRSYPITCPYCGWCAIYDRNWVARHSVLTCERCECRTQLYKTANLALDPTAITTLADHAAALAAHPEAFRAKWVPHGPGTVIKKGVLIPANIRYRGLAGTAELSVTIKVIIGFELNTGYKITAFRALPAGERQSKEFKIWMVETLADGRNGMAVKDIAEWLSTMAALPLSPD